MECIRRIRVFSGCDVIGATETRIRGEMERTEILMRVMAVSQFEGQNEKGMTWSWGARMDPGWVGGVEFTEGPAVMKRMKKC